MTEQEKQKQIEEITNIIGKCDVTEKQDDVIYSQTTYFSIKEIAQTLVNAGYGDTKQAVREFAEKVQYDVLNYVLKQFKPKPDDKLTNVIYSISRKIDELVKEICNK